MWLDALQNLFQVSNLLIVLLGTALGIVFGVLPGIGSIQGIALLLPLTFGMEPATALILLGSIYNGSVYGGAITSILLNTPGDPTSAATVFDGFPMAQNGRAGEAIGAATTVSFVGGVTGVAFLILLAPVLTKLALLLGPPEYFMLTLFGLSIITVAVRGNVVKGLISAGMGLMLRFFGLSPVTGVPRFTFGITYLQDGISFVALTVGLFAISEALILLEEGESIAKLGKVTGGVWDGVRKSFRYPATIARSALMGIGLGALPGIGATTANLLAYLQTVRSSKHPETFGTGDIEGVIASETANNAVIGASLTPTLTLGIPGSAGTAVLMGALVIQGLRPGPGLFTTDAIITYTFILGLILSNVAFMLMGLLLANQFAKITVVPIRVLAPLMMLLAFLASYADRNSLNDVVVSVLIGVGAYFFRKYGFPLVPLIIAFILSPIAENSLYQSLLMSSGSFGIFVTRPVSLVMLLVLVLSLAMPMINKYLSAALRHNPKSV